MQPRAAAADDTQDEEPDQAKQRTHRPSVAEPPRIAIGFVADEAKSV
jgi:hypothetical protein